MRAETKKDLNKDFIKPKSDSQLVIEFKEVMMKVKEMPWDFDQRLMCQIRHADIQIIDSQHPH